MGVAFGIYTLLLAAMWLTGSQRAVTGWGFIDTSSLDERGSDMRGCDKRGNNEQVSCERKSDKRGSDERDRSRCLARRAHRCSVGGL